MKFYISVEMRMRRMKDEKKLGVHKDINIKMERNG